MIPDRNQSFVSLDVLSSGTSHEPPSLFLSIWKESVTKDKPVGEFGKLISRYALSGALNSRVVADQRYRIGSVNALFVGATTTTNSNCSKEGQAVEAIISLLYALTRGGSDELVVVAPQAESYCCRNGKEVSRICEAVELLHGSKAYPAVKICELNQANMQMATWWKVFEDDATVVHAHWSTTHSLLFLFTLRDVQPDEVQGTSLLYIPDLATIEACQATFRDISAPKCTMPVIEYESGPPMQSKIWCVVVGSAPPDIVDIEGWIFLKTESPSTGHSNNRLLRRGFQQQERWKRIYPNLCKEGLFPWYTPSVCGEDDSQPPTSLIGKTILMSKFSSKPATFSVIDRLAAARQDTSSEKDENTSEATLRHFLTNNKTSAVDSNEISLDDSDDESKECDADDSFLQILGTGCAAPSPHRNASAQVLVLQGRSILLDAGEGTVIQWHRYLSQISIASIGIIWISHAHWDHFGGLIDVLRRIYKERNSTVQDRSKRSRGESPFVVAPPKILKYIDTIFRDQILANYCQKVVSDDRMAIERMISAFNQSFSPTKIVDWKHTRVDHSCLAYAVRIDLSIKSAAFSLVFSGDTRPTEQVRNLCLPHVDLLIHEATYEDHDLAMAKTKKHSTRAEALAIGNGIAKRTLLTHFSQRYNGVRIEAGRDDQTGTLWMAAVDGLRIPLQFTN